MASKSKKTHPELIDPILALQAAQKTCQRGALYSYYIQATFRKTGNLAPGCDAVDLLAWYEANFPEAFLPFDQRPAVASPDGGAEIGEVLVYTGRPIPLWKGGPAVQSGSLFLVRGWTGHNCLLNWQDAPAGVPTELDVPAELLPVYFCAQRSA